MLIHITIIEVSAAPVCVLCACARIHREYRTGERGLKSQTDSILSSFSLTLQWRTGCLKCVCSCAALRQEKPPKSMITLL